MPVRIEVNPELYSWARRRSGIADDVWQKRFPRYEAWQSGAAQPTMKQLTEFARKTYTPVGQFFLGAPPVEQVPIPDFRTVGDRPVGGPDAASPSADLLDTVYVCQARQEWYRDNQLRNGEQPLEFVGIASLKTAPATAAADMRAILDWTSTTRNKLRSWEAALTQLRENAEAAGILVMISGMVGSNTRRKLNPQEFRGFALVDQFAAVVFVNGADSKAAQVFTLAHELAHLWLGEKGLSDVDPQSARNYDEERWCNEVAAELLVPMEEFRLAYDPARELRAQLTPLAEQFRVSTQVILGRMREMGALTWDQFMVELRAERARVAAIVEARGGGGNFYYTKPVQVGKRFARELITSTLEGQTPYTEAFRLLHVNKTATFNGLGEQLGVI